MRGAVLAATLLCACASVAGDVPAPMQRDGVRWVQVVASEHDDWINDIVRLSDGLYVASGFLNRTDGGSDWRAMAVTFDARGRIARQDEYGAGGGVDAFFATAEHEDGGFLHAGFTGRIGAGGLDVFVVRTDAQGRLLAETTMGEAAYDRVTGIARAPGGYLLAGHSVAPGTTARRVLLAKVDGDGKELWRRIVTEGDASGALYVAPSPDGAFVVTGGTSRGDDGDLLVLKIDADGRELWRRTFGTTAGNDINHGVVVRPDGDIVAVGYTQSWGAEEHDLFAVTLSPAGDVRRHSVLGGPGDDRAIDASMDAQGRIWIIGYTQAPGAAAWDLALARLDPRGCFEANGAVLDFGADDHGTVVLPLAGEDLLLAGYTTALGRGGEDAFLMRTAPPVLADPRLTVRVRC